MLTSSQRGFTKALCAWHRVASLLAAALLATGCATAGAASGTWAGASLPPDVDEDVLEEGAEAEATRAVAEVWAAARGVQEVGARLSFTFWSEHGALTLTGYMATGRSGRQGGKVDEKATLHTLATALRSFAQHRTGMSQVTLEREETQWKVGYGWVEEARVLRLPSAPQPDAEFAAQYRLMHEDILRRWREETKEGMAWVAREGAEELALWYVGGILTKGVGWLGARTLPAVMTALRRGGAASAGWLRTTLSRLSVEKKKTFERLWTKVQLEGKQALSSDERTELRGLMEGLEQLVRKPLDASEKVRLRAEARKVYKRLHPHLEQALDSGSDHR